ncbi:1,3-beta-galactosyl-N-acetylhexosamine phosphorylase C-terminal domain-containing protein [uncultured Robinsoniella sp.]
MLVIINNSKETQRTSVSTEFGTIRAELEGFGTRMIEL